jgi:hypothetical protein
VGFTVIVEGGTPPTESYAKFENLKKITVEMGEWTNMEI